MNDNTSRPVDPVKVQAVLDARPEWAETSELIDVIRRAADTVHVGLSHDEAWMIAVDIMAAGWAKQHEETS